MYIRPDSHGHGELILYDFARVILLVQGEKKVLRPPPLPLLSDQPTALLVSPRNPIGEKPKP
jgi:hypothetical protein